MGTGIKAVLVRDNLDDRREIHQLLHRLPAARQLAYLEHCCERSAVAPRATAKRPEVAARTRTLAAKADREERQGRWSNEHSRKLSLDVFYDLWAMSIEYRLDLDRVLNDLAEMVQAHSRGHG